MTRDVTIHYYLPTHEIEYLDKLCNRLKEEQNIKISRAEATRQALLYFSDHLPAEIDAAPRAAYKRGTSSSSKVPFQLPPEMLDTVEKWAENYSSSRNQIIRQAVIDFANSKGIEWPAAAPSNVKVEPEWERIEIDTEIAVLLSGMTKVVIHKYANLGKYRVIETDEIRYGNVKRNFTLADIVRFYEIPYEEVVRFVKEGEEAYKRRRYSEVRKRDR